MKLFLKKNNSFNLIFALLALVYYTEISSINLVFWQKEIAFIFPLQLSAIAYILWFNRRNKNKP
ncbi:MAG: hypothetical protein DCF12_13440 [Snowella sp.]|nr:MAG: hypothetical protein DCF12_13440 [Snowella sp.]